MQQQQQQEQQELSMRRTRPLLRMRPPARSTSLVPGLRRSRPRGASTAGRRPWRAPPPPLGALPPLVPLLPLLLSLLPLPLEERQQLLPPLPTCPPGASRGAFSGAAAAEAVIEAASSVPAATSRARRPPRATEGSFRRACFWPLRRAPRRWEAQGLASRAAAGAACLLEACGGRGAAAG